MNKQKTLYSCGGSYMSVDLPPANITSFLEAFAQRRNLNHVSLGRVGATNFLVRLQIDEAIRKKADYVIVSSVPADRIDVVLDTDLEHDFFHLRHAQYRQYGCVSELNIDDADVKFIGDAVHHALKVRHDLSVDQKNAVKSFVAHLHNASLQRQKDYYIICDGLRSLQQENIPFIFIPECMDKMNWGWLDPRCMWPKNQPSPMDMPFGACNDGTTVNHNNQLSHNLLTEILESSTPGWH